MTDSATIALQENGAQGPEHIDVRGDTATSTVRRRVPLFVSRNQLYYWTREWQAGEAEALSDLEKGRFDTFPDGTSAARWLSKDED
jgi:hypothetical protein